MVTSESRDRLIERSMPAECFISYASADLAHAELVYRALIVAGIPATRIWFDRSRLEPGFDWYTEICSAAEACRRTANSHSEMEGIDLDAI